MLYTIMRHIRNFFAVKNINGKFNIENGAISLSDIKDGQYFLIEGSIFNNGVYKYPVNNLKDEEFTGYITFLAPPEEFLQLVKEIEEYEASENKSKGFTSESFGGYSYTKATGENGAPLTWQAIFNDRLNVWRKI